MSRSATIHICPYCRMTSLEGGPFQKVIYREDTVEIDGFRFCSTHCRLAMDDDGPDFHDPQFKLRRGGIRSAQFRRDRTID